MRSILLILLTLVTASHEIVAEDRAVAHQSFQVIVVPRVRVTEEANQLHIKANVALAVQLEEFKAVVSSESKPVISKSEVMTVPAEPFATMTVSTAHSDGSLLRVMTITSLH